MSFLSADAARSKKVEQATKVYKCDECDYIAGRLDHLTAHKVVHTGERPYKCDECDYSAGRPAHLTLHKSRIHKKEKSHKCDECGYATVTKSDLTVHQRIHSRKYKCDECPYSCERQSNLEQHKLKKHLFVVETDQPYLDPGTSSRPTSTLDLPEIFTESEEQKYLDDYL